MAMLLGKPGSPADRPSAPPLLNAREAAGDILVVDDSPGNLLAIEAAFGDLSSRLVKVGSGAEALRRLLEQDFALILLDVQMPGMDGFETAHLIRSRERTRHLPIIFITAYSANDDKVLQGYALGAVDFLFKPIVPEVLRAKAAVFVELQQRTAEVVRQAALLREHERRELEHRLAGERQRWEAAALRQQMEEHERFAMQMAERADELARTVAEREEARRELSRINERLEEADRRKDEFIAMLAHELRNPIASVVTSLELMRVKQIEDPMLNRARETMMRQIRHLTRLVDDLLDVSRITSGKMELLRSTVDLGSIVSEAVEMTRAAIEQRAQKLSVRLPDPPVSLSADAVRLTQVVANLLSNATRYTGEHGHIELSCEQDSKVAVVRVSDNGQGIAPELLERVFDMFVQNRSGGAGLGLGLTLVRRLVEMHGGAVHAESAGSGRGSQFTVRLPLSDADPLSVPSSEQVGPITDRSLRIVVVEDDADVREALCALLEQWGHQVQAAKDGGDGVELVLRERPDVAVVDIGLPRLDGYGVAERVRDALGEQRPRMLALTGMGRDWDRQRAFDAGFDAHLVKPASAPELRRALMGELFSAERVIDATNSGSH
jgi:signal transduction histidine kinase